MIQSLHNRYVFYAFPGELVEGNTLHGGWYFRDEAEHLINVSYATEQLATEAWKAYLQTVMAAGDEDSQAFIAARCIEQYMPATVESRLEILEGSFRSWDDQ